MAVNRDNNECKQLLNNNTITDCYDLLNAIAANPVYSESEKPAKLKKSKKAFILTTTMKHVKFLETTLKSVLNGEDQQTLTYGDYQRKFVAEIQTEFEERNKNKSAAGLKVKRRKIQSNTEDEESGTSQHSVKKRNVSEVKVKNSVALFSQSLLTPKTESVSEFKMSQNTPEFGSREKNRDKPKCCKNLESAFLLSETNEVDAFDGFFKFYQTVTNLLEQVIPFSVISSESARNFIANIWSELPKDHQTKFISMATENGSLADLSEKHNSSMMLFSEGDIFSFDGQDIWDIPDLPDLTDMCAKEFDFEDLKPLF